MSLGNRDLDVIGRWPSKSRTNERYGRSARARDLPHRIAIIQRMLLSWKSAGAPAYTRPTRRMGELGRIRSPAGRGGWAEIPTMGPTDRERIPAANLVGAHSDGEPSCGAYLCCAIGATDGRTSPTEIVGRNFCESETRLR